MLNDPKEIEYKRSIDPKEIEYKRYCDVVQVDILWPVKETTSSATEMSAST